MTTIDFAIDDYLHTIVRTRPWTKKREEELLEGFSAWQSEQPAPRMSLDAVTADDLHRYAAAANLDDAERDELAASLHHVFLWSIRQGWVDVDPFAPVTAV